MLPGAAGLLAPLMLALAFSMAPWPLPFSVKENMEGAVAATGTVVVADAVPLLVTITGTLVCPATS